MTDSNTRQPGDIEALLATRQRISEWLHRLGQTGSTVPAAVRDRVRADYQGRLSRVVEELRGHSTAISDTVSGLRRELGERESVRAAEEEALAEAQLRHAVGEYAEEEWRAHEERSGTRLESLGAEIHHLAGEIERLEDVLVQIAGAPGPVAQAAAPAGEAELETIVEDAGGSPVGASASGEEYHLQTDTFITLDDEPVDPRTQSVFDAPPSLPSDPDPALEMPAPEPVVPEAPRFTPRGGAMPPRPRATAKPVEDELAFLRSVTSGPAAGRPAVLEKKAAVSAAAVATKTLKCQDCGTLNRPTEWYCERCGAELSAV